MNSPSAAEFMNSNCSHGNDWQLCIWAGGRKGEGENYAEEEHMHCSIGIHGVTKPEK